LLAYLLLFCIGPTVTSKIIISGEMLGTPTKSHAIVIYDDAGQKKRLNSTLLDKHDYSNFIRNFLLAAGPNLYR